MRPILPVLGFKSLLCLTVFCLPIHSAVFAGQSHAEMPAVAVPAPEGAPPAVTDAAPSVDMALPSDGMALPSGDIALPPSDTLLKSLDPIPPGMSVEEFTQHMQGAHEAFLTLDDFVALRTAEPDLAVLDVRSAAAFEQRHLRGSYNLPVTDMTEHTLPALLPERGRAVVLVCDESFFPTRRLSMTLQAWPVLKANGYTRVYRLNLWRPAADGLPANGPAEIAKHVDFDGLQVVPQEMPAQAPVQTPAAPVVIP